jgi:hypothetical protein
MVFAKITMPLVQKWRSRGRHVLPYLDDFLGGGASPEEASEFAFEMLSDMQQAGWLVGASKVKLDPCRVITHLGLVVDLVFPGGRFRVPVVKAESVRKLVRKALAQVGRRVSVRLLARITGKFQSFKLALGPVVNFYTRYLYIEIASARSWNGDTVLGDEAWSELHKLLKVDFGVFSGLVWRPLTWAVMGAQMSFYSDAGARGWGGRLILPSGVGFDGRGYLTE